MWLSLKRKYNRDRRQTAAPSRVRFGTSLTGRAKRRQWRKGNHASAIYCETR